MAGKFGGFGGGAGGFGGGNMQQLMKQAQKMQQDMQEAQQKLAESEVTASVSGGLVQITMTGAKALTAIKIKPEAVDTEDMEMLEDLIVAAFNEAVKKVDDLHQELLGPYANAMGGLM